jgi:hypothetical protein
VVLDDILLNKIPMVPNAQQKIIPHTPINVRHSTRVSRPPKLFSQLLYSILLIDYGEFEDYEEAM